MYILRTRTRTIVDEDDAGETTRRVITTGFSPVAVFNVTQTSGPAVPAPPVTSATGELAPGVLDGLRSRVGAAGYTYREEPIVGCDPAKGTGTLRGQIKGPCRLRVPTKTSGRCSTVPLPT